jgi:Zn-dependent protease with chaperone function
MSTDFFTSQDNARKQTGRLIALFIFGVIATMVSLWLALAVPIALMGAKSNGGEPNWAGALGNWKVALGVFAVVGAIVGIVTLFKLSQLSAGGTAIAEMLGGRPIDPATRDPKERQLLNLVEEMSIASGVPVPPVYVMDDKSVNAFAAGPDPSRSVIGVTRGCMELLSRDELQGVIAHEYSHIFHGDTRINARTTAVIAGIMAVGVLGYIMFRFVGPSIARSGGGRKNNGAAVGVAIILLGLLVWGIGSLGMLFGRLIQAAISRQREFLADAAAVQYTRNPDGIAGALAKIRDHYSARIEHPNASELNHFFFCTSLNTLFATHPPIDERIKRIVAMGATKVGASEVTRATRSSGAAASGVSTAGAIGFAAAGETASAGTLAPDSIARAHAFKDALPDSLEEAARTPEGARAICYAIARRTAGHEACDALVAKADQAAYKTYAAIAVDVAKQRADAQLALADLCAPALAHLGQANYLRFRETLAAAMRSDGQVDLREWALAKSLERHVERRFHRGAAPARGRLGTNAQSARIVVGIIASATHDQATAERAFRDALRVLGFAERPLPDSSERTLDQLNSATKALSTTSFADREQLLAACATAASHDGRVSVDEHLIVRAVADALDVPMPALAGA